MSANALNLHGSVLFSGKGILTLHQMTKFQTDPINFKRLAQQTRKNQGLFGNGLKGGGGLCGKGLTHLKGGALP